MPYASSDDLPESIGTHLPPHARFCHARHARSSRRSPRPGGPDPMAGQSRQRHLRRPTAARCHRPSARHEPGSDLRYQFLRAGLRSLFWSGKAAHDTRLRLAYWCRIIVLLTAVVPGSAHSQSDIPGRDPSTQTIKSITRLIFQSILPFPLPRAWPCRHCPPCVTAWSNLRTRLRRKSRLMSGCV